MTTNTKRKISIMAVLCASLVSAFPQAAPAAPPAPPAGGTSAATPVPPGCSGAPAVPPNQGSLQPPANPAIPGAPSTTQPVPPGGSVNQPQGQQIPTQSGFPATNFPAGNANTARIPQLNTGATPGAAVAASAGAADPRVITPAQRIMIGRLATDFTGVNNQMTPAQAQQIMATLQASTAGPFRPSDAAMTRLINNMAGVWPARGFTPQQRTQLALDLHRLVNSSGLTGQEIQAVLSDAQAVFQSSGMNAQAMTTLNNDFAAIAAELQQQRAFGAQPQGLIPRQPPQAPQPAPGVNPAPPATPAPVLPGPTSPR